MGGSAAGAVNPFRAVRRFLIGIISTILVSVVLPLVLITSAASRMEQVIASLGTMQQSRVSGMSYGTLDIEGCRVTALSYFTYYESHARYDAVLGGRERGCCGAYQFHYRYELQPFIDYALSQDSTRYAVLAPYGSASTSRESLKDNAGLASAWQAASAMDPDGFRALQDRYVYETKWIPIRDFHAARGLQLDSRPDVIKGLILSIHNRMGLETNAGLSIIIRSGVTNATPNAEFITSLCDTFAAAYPDSDIHDRYVVDYSSAACGSVSEKTMALNILNGEYGIPVSMTGGGQLMTLSPERFLQEVAAVADMARNNVWHYGHSTTQVPCEDGMIACDRLESRALWNLGFTDQRTGGEIVESLIPYLQAKGAITITDQSQVRAGDIIIVGAYATGKPDHAFTVASYDPATGICTKYDMGDEWRIHSMQPFTAPLNEWTNRRYFMMALRMPGGEMPILMAA